MYCCVLSVEKFKLITGDVFIPAQLDKLHWPAIMGSMFLGFSLSLLFFMDQSIAGAMVNSPENRSDQFQSGQVEDWPTPIAPTL